MTHVVKWNLFVFITSSAIHFIKADDVSSEKNLV